ncbi:hypothetical protein PTKIN_Ptkin17bG0046000 [Pterospermum kingtungense]
MMGALATSIAGVFDPLMIEALVAVKTLEVARDMGFSKVVLEGDSTRVIAALVLIEMICMLLAWFLWKVGLCLLSF